MNGRDRIVASAALAIMGATPYTASYAQTIDHFSEEQGPATIVEEDQTSSSLQPRIIERRVLVLPEVPRLSEESLPQKRSNYSKRLGDMLEQLSFAYERGWLSSRQYADLKSWEASVAMEELVLRDKGSGIIPRADVEQMERHLNGLAYTINRAISDGSRVASAGDNGI